PHRITAEQRTRPAPSPRPKSGERERSESAAPLCIDPNGYCLPPPAAFLMPADELRFAEQKKAIERVPENRKRKDTRVHFRHLEGAFREQREIAQPIGGHDHLRQNCQDERDGEADPHPGEDLRARSW